METFVDVGELKLVGGTAILDLANTQSGPPGGAPDIESLRDYGDLLRWAVRVEILDDAEAKRLARSAERRPAAAREAFERARRAAWRRLRCLRGAGRGQATSRCRGGPPAGRGDRGAGPREHHGRGGTFAVRWDETDDPHRAWWPVAYAGLELLLHGPLHRIKGCGGCRYLFIDETKNRSRRWCSMDDCGTREKMRIYVARRAARRSRPTTPDTELPHGASVGSSPLLS